jgi:alanine racemase
VELRGAGIDSDILILGHTPAELIPCAQRHNITVTVASESAARAYNAAVTCGERLRCHLKIDTGMSRLGCSGTELVLEDYPNLRFEGVFTHLPVSDENSKNSREYTGAQIERFRAIAEHYGLPYSHCANSGGVVAYPASCSAPFNLARPGIALYGHYAGLELLPAMEWFAKIFQIHEVKIGDTVGYGQTWRARRASKIGVLGVGYADGYRRALSNVGEVFINGRRAPVVGRVCMDLTMIDVTEVPGAEVGSTAELFGRHVTVEEMAERLGTITYELLTNVGRRVTRVYK